MPGFSGTGPRGEGPMTGGGRGMCATDERGLIGRFVPGGMGFGRGYGHGLRAAARDRGRGMGLGLRYGGRR